MTPLPAEDVRDKRIGLRADDPALTRTLAKIRTAAADQGVSPTGLARDILLDASGYQSTVRRETQRRGQAPRPGRRAPQPGLWIPLSAGEHAHITRYAADNGTTITEWAWTELALAMKPKRTNRKRQEGHQ